MSILTNNIKLQRVTDLEVVVLGEERPLLLTVVNNEYLIMKRKGSAYALPFLIIGRKGDPAGLPYKIRLPTFTGNPEEPDNLTTFGFYYHSNLLYL